MTTDPCSTRRAALLALAASSLAPAAWAQSGPFPSQPIKIVVAAPPGGEADTVARMLADALQPRLGVPVLVDNRPGAGATVASTTVARAAPDGYTLYLAGSGLTASPAILKAASDPVKDFTPISQVLSLEFYLVVRNDSKVRTLPEFLAWAKGRTDPLNYGSAGLGTITHFQMEMLKSLGKFNAVHVPYKGTAPALTALMAGDIQMMFASAPAVPHIRSGSLRPVALATPSHSKDFPDVALLSDTYPSFTAYAWTGLIGPANMPAAVVDKLNAATVAVVNDPAFAAKVKTMGGQAVSSTPQAMGERLKTETARYVALGASLGLKPE